MSCWHTRLKMMSVCARVASKTVLTIRPYSLSSGTNAHRLIAARRTPVVVAFALAFWRDRLRARTRRWSRPICRFRTSRAAIRVRQPEKVARPLNCTSYSKAAFYSGTHDYVYGTPNCTPDDGTIQAFTSTEIAVTARL